MSDLEQLTELIKGVLGGDNQTIKNNEAILKTIRERDINQYITTFFTLLHGNYPVYTFINLIRVSA